MRKFIGVVLIIVAVILSLAILSILPKLLMTFLGVSGILTGKFDAYRIGYLIGNYIGLIIITALTFFSWKFGLRFIKSQNTKSNQDNEAEVS